MLHRLATLMKWSYLLVYSVAR